MAQLDKLIEKAQAGQEIIMEADKASMLKSESGTAPMLAQQLSSGQIFCLVGEIAPAFAREQVAQSKTVKFDHTFSGRTVTVDFSVENGQAELRRPPRPASRR
jgi:hypothetical protein